LNKYSISNLYRLKLYLGTKNEIFNSISQEDCPSALRIILDLIHIECKQMPISLKISKKNNKTLQEQAKDEFIKDIQKNGYSIINQLYRGQYYIPTVCNNSKCKNILHSFDLFGEIVLDLKKDTVSECLNEFLSNIETIDDYNCDSCKNKTSVSRKYNIIAFPKKLVIKLNRFENYNYKSHKDVKINKELLFHDDNKQTKYRLNAIVHHIGRSQLGGHYITDVFKNNILYRMDDDNMTKHEYDNYEFFVSNSAYMLIYDKV